MMRHAGRTLGVVGGWILGLASVAACGGGAQPAVTTGAAAATEVAASAPQAVADSGSTEAPEVNPTTAPEVATLEMGAETLAPAAAETVQADVAAASEVALAPEVTVASRADATVSGPPSKADVAIPQPDTTPALRDTAVATEVAVAPADTSVVVVPETTVAPADTATPAGPSANGAEVYARSCAKCHGGDGQGKTKMGDKIRADGGKLPPLGHGALGAITAAIRDGVANTPMKAFGSRLTPAEIAAVAAYVKGL